MPTRDRRQKEDVVMKQDALLRVIIQNLLKNPALNLVQSVSMQSDSVISSEDEESDSDAYEEKIEEKIENKKRLIDHLLLRVAGSNAIDAAVERRL